MVSYVHNVEGILAGLKWRRIFVRKKKKLYYTSLSWEYQKFEKFLKR